MFLWEYWYNAAQVFASLTPNTTLIPVYRVYLPISRAISSNILTEIWQRQQQHQTVPLGQTRIV